MSYNITSTNIYTHMTYTAGNTPYLKKYTHDIHFKFLTQKKKKRKKRRVTGHQENVRYLCTGTTHDTHFNHVKQIKQIKHK